MKNINRFLSVLLMLVAVLTMSFVVSAEPEDSEQSQDNTNTVQSDNVAENDTFRTYRIIESVEGENGNVTFRISQKWQSFFDTNNPGNTFVKKGVENYNVIGELNFTDELANKLVTAAAKWAEDNAIEPDYVGQGGLVVEDGGLGCYMVKSGEDVQFINTAYIEPVPQMQDIEIIDGKVVNFENKVSDIESRIASVEEDVNKLKPEVQQEVKQAKLKLRLDVKALTKSFPLMGVGMAGIFIVIAAIALCVSVLTKIFPDKKQ